MKLIMPQMAINSSLMFPPLLMNAVTQSNSGKVNRIFFDIEERDPQRSVRPLLGEEKLWANVLIQAIQDYKGVTKNAAEECIDCHQHTHPTCFNTWIRNGEPFLLRANQKCRDWHTISECANRWIFDDENRGDGTFHWVCDHLNLEADYLRKNLNNATFEEYWKDEARINVYLGFQTARDVNPCVSAVPKSHVHPGHTDSSGEED